MLKIEPCCRCEWFHSPIHERITDGSRPSSPDPSQSPAKHLKAGPRLARKDGLQNGLRIGFKKPVVRVGSAEELIEEYPENQVDLRSYGMVGRERERRVFPRLNGPKPFSRGPSLWAYYSSTRVSERRYEWSIRSFAADDKVNLPFRVKTC